MAARGQVRLSGTPYGLSTFLHQTIFKNIVTTISSRTVEVFTEEMLYCVCALAVHDGTRSKVVHWSGSSLLRKGQIYKLISWTLRAAENLAYSSTLENWDAVGTTVWLQHTWLELSMYNLISCSISLSSSQYCKAFSQFTFTALFLHSNCRVTHATRACTSTISAFYYK